MKKQLASLEIHYIVQELQALINSRVDKIYHSKNEELIIQFYVQNIGKKILKILPGKNLYLTEIKEDHEEPSAFCMFLRKHLGNSRIKQIRQIKPERIVELVFEKAGKKSILIVEFLTKGNIVFCDENYTIINALEFVDFSTRSIRPKVKYEHPKMEYNFFKITKENLSKLLKKTKKENIVKCLAVDLGLEGIYSEEVCLLSNINKNKESKKLSDKEINTIIKSIKNLINKKTNPLINYKNNEAIDVFPFKLEFYKDLEEKKFSLFNEALDYYFSKEVKAEKKPTKYDKDMEKIKRIIEEQKLTIENLKKSEKKNREKGELIYNNYKLIEEILKEVNKASEKHSWKEIKEKLKGHKVVRDIDIKEKKVTININ